MKRAFDILASLIAIIVTWPIFVVVAVAVALDMGRPVLFRQTRGARGDEVFDVVKFRSMKPQPDSGPALDDAARVTRLGLFLRRTRFDELPQLWLILAGRMAFVGPRPLFPDPHDPELSDLFYYRRQVSPGMTGWSQVNGNTLLTEGEKLALDAWYVGHQALLLDLWILLKTAWTVVRGEARNEANIEEAVHYARHIGRDGR